MIAYPWNFGGLASLIPPHVLEASSATSRLPEEIGLPMQFFRLASGFFAIETLLLLLLATPSHAARCGGDFNSFVASISADAQGAGVSQGVVSTALSGVSEDMAVLNFDRRQRYTFNKSFEQYVSTRVGAGRINGGRAMLARHAALFSSIEAKFGVPRQILVAIWGLETDFGKGDMGRVPLNPTLPTPPPQFPPPHFFPPQLLPTSKSLH